MPSSVFCFVLYSPSFQDSFTTLRADVHVLSAKRTPLYPRVVPALRRSFTGIPDMFPFSHYNQKEKRFNPIASLYCLSTTPSIS